jgi:acylphosphatase
VFAGPTEIVAGMIEACRKGPWGARVGGVDVREGAEAELAQRGSDEEFSVLPTI